MNIPCTESGSILLTGYEQNMQAILGRQIAAEHLAKGGAVVALVDDAQDARELTGQMADVLRAIEADKSVLERFATIERVGGYTDADTLQFSVEKVRARRAPLLVARFWNSMQELRPDDAWLKIAADLALLLQRPVWTISHHGRVGPPAPRYRNYLADSIWVAQAGLSLGVTLTRPAKPTEAKVTLAGKMLHGSVIAFENVEEPSYA